MPDMRLDALPRPAGWNIPTGYPSWARWCLSESERIAEEISEKSELQRTGKLDVDQYLAEKRILVERAELHAHAAVLFAAMAVEAFLNFYGVVRLSERFFTDNIERLNPNKKLAVLLATTCKTLLDPNSEIVAVTGRLFDGRNHLVHPKTKEMADRVIRVPPDADYLGAPRQAIGSMSRFFELFVNYEPDSARDIQLMEMSSLTRQ